MSWDGEIMDPQMATFGVAEYMGGLPEETIFWGDVYLTRYDVNQPPDDLVDHIISIPDVLKIGSDGPGLVGIDLIYDALHPGCPVIFHAWWWRGEAGYPDAKISYRFVSPDDPTRILAQYDFKLSGELYDQEYWQPGTPTLGRGIVYLPDGVDEVTAAIVIYDTGLEPQYAEVGTLDIVPGGSCPYLVFLRE
jgi:hypothetical protein